MADQVYETKMRITSDVSGAVATGREYDKLLAKAKDLGNRSVEESKKSKAAFGDLSKAVAGLRRALSGFGTAALFGALISGINRVKESFSAAKKQADELAKINKELGESKAIQQLAARYDQLKDSIAAAANAQKARLDQIDEDVSGRRRLDKANLEAAKQREIEALDPNAADYAERKAQIEARYAAQGANMEASNAREDIVLKRQRLGVEAETKDQEAAAEDANAERIRAELAQTRRRQSAAALGAADLNAADKGGVMDTIGKTLMQLFTGQWGRAAGATTEEGDAIRLQKAKESADLELRIAKLEEQLRQSEERAGALRTEAGNIRTRADGMGTLLEASDIEAETARRQGDTGEAAAAAALSKKQEEEAEKIRVQEDAVRAKALLERQKAELQAQIATQQGRISSAGLAVFGAQGAYDVAAANGDRQGMAGAAQSLASAQQTAQNVEFSAGTLITNLEQKLKDVESLLNKANNAIAKNNSQRLTAQAEALTTN